MMNSTVNSAAVTAPSRRRGEPLAAGAAATSPGSAGLNLQGDRILRDNPVTRHLVAPPRRVRQPVTSPTRAEAASAPESSTAEEKSMPGTDIRDSTVIVTGASRGFGRGIAAALSLAGVQVVG